GPDGFPREHHLPIFKFTAEIKITALIVNPGLLPPASASLEYGDAAAAKMHGLAAREVLLDDAAVENAVDAVCAMPGITGANPLPDARSGLSMNVSMLIFILAASILAAAWLGLYIAKRRGHPFLETQADPQPWSLPQLVLASFLTLFAELAFIRWIAVEVRVF